MAPPEIVLNNRNPVVLKAKSQSPVLIKFVLIENQEKCVNTLSEDLRPYNNLKKQSRKGVMYEQNFELSHGILS